VTTKINANMKTTNVATITMISHVAQDWSVRMVDVNQRLPLSHPTPTLTLTPTNTPELPHSYPETTPIVTPEVTLTQPKLLPDC